MESKEHEFGLELGLGLSVSGSSTPAAGATGGLLSFILTMEDVEDGRSGLQPPTEAGIGASLAAACSAEVRSLLEQQRRDWRTKGRDFREKELLEAHSWSLGSKPVGVVNPPVVPVPYPPHPQVMYVPAVDGLGAPCMIPCWAPAVLTVGCRCSGTAGRDVVVRAESTGSSSSDISVRRNGSMQARSRSQISSRRDVCGKSLHIWEKPQTQKAVSVQAQFSDEKLATKIRTSDITLASAIPKLESFNSVNNPIMGTKEPKRSFLPRMPSVTTTGDGPNGKRITGVLYKYSQFEQVSILCDCHGMPFSPAEFVRHAGGTGTTNPLRQIVVVLS